MHFPSQTLLSPLVWLQLETLFSVSRTATPPGQLSESSKLVVIGAADLIGIVLFVLLILWGKEKGFWLNNLSNWNWKFWKKKTPKPANTVELQEVVVPPAGRGNGRTSTATGAAGSAGGNSTIKPARLPPAADLSRWSRRPTSPPNPVRITNPAPAINPATGRWYSPPHSPPAAGAVSPPSKTAEGIDLDDTPEWQDAEARAREERAWNWDRQRRVRFSDNLEEVMSGAILTGNPPGERERQTVAPPNSDLSDTVRGTSRLPRQPSHLLRQRPSLRPRIILAEHHGIRLLLLNRSLSSKSSRRRDRWPSRVIRHRRHRLS
ncbi:hypothetical protein B0H63DRAFT_530396 [Podospora didyma]|uniref:Uncharacterized protein n=1 Tax=Podospora didyma TaxID=330526 RepID=A0AAE0P446_9PEZI|nr:hypothetical protein B0H63DRAFT_530396 [Podospora didyma]